ncbi:MAG TPA: hypothetical protein VK492_09300 [Chitinophagaceae bacterium]|nr:hypothetical protein [Chitinophagaceae bacterium]
MRKLILLTIFLPISFLLKAQAHEGTIEYNKGKQACIVMEYNYPPEAVENAMRAKLLKLGYGGKEEKGMFNKDKGFRVYKETTVGEISPNKYDYAINIERKSHKEADETIVSLVIFKDDANALSKLSSEELEKVKSFLNNLLPEVEASNLEILIGGQILSLEKADKKLKTLQDENKKLQEALEKNIKDQELQKKEIENQNKSLDSLKGRRKTSA